MRVLVVTRSLPFHRLGGMEAVAWDLSRALVRDGAEVTVLTTQCESLPPSTTIEGVDIHCLPVRSGRYSAGWWAKSRAAYSERYATWADVVLSVGRGALAIAKERPATSRSPAMIVQAHGTAWGEVLSKLRERTLIAWLKSANNLLWMWTDRGYRRFDAMAAVGDVVAKDLVASPTCHIIGDVPVHLISNGIDTQVFRYDAQKRQEIRARLGLAENELAAISLSRLNRQKGLLEAIDGFALAARRNPDLRYIVAGSGPIEAELRAKVEAEGLGGKVMFAGAVPRDEMYSYLSAADVFLFTTLRQEGLPLNLLEALACGLPCVVSDHINHPDFGAFGVDPRNAAAVAQGIDQAVAQIAPVRSSRLKDTYTLSFASSAYLRLFESLRSASSGRSAAPTP